MKKKLFPLIALLSVFILWGCPGNNPVEEDPVLTPNTTSFKVKAEGGDITISFSTNLDYTVKTDATWLTVSTKTKAVETKSVTVTAAPNTSIDSRRANVTIDGGKVNATIVVIQDGVVPTIEIAATSFPVSADGGTISVRVDSNVEYEVTVNDSWVEYKGGTDGTEMFEVSANSSESDRTATVTFSYGGISKNITITQNGKQKEEEPYINIGTGTFSLPAEGGPVNVTVSSNVSYEVKVNASWVEYKGLSGTTEAFEVGANSSESDRTATVTFSYGNISKTVSISQKGKKEEPYINITNRTYNMPADGGSFDVSVSSNVNYSVAISADWVSGSGNSYTVAPNSGTSARSATVTYSYGDISVVVTVNQAAKGETPPEEPDVLENGSSPTYTVAAEGESIEVTVRANVEYTVEVSADWIVRTKACTVREDKLTFVVSPNDGAERNAAITFKYEDISFTVTVRQEAYVPPVEDPVLEVSPTELTVPAEGGEASINVNANYEYTVDCESEWITATAEGNVVRLTIEANPATEIRSAMLTVSSEGLLEFVTVNQEPAQSNEDPFDVGGNLSVNGTANCYVVTKAGDYTFDASVMGNGEDGIIWDENQLEGLHLWPKKSEQVHFTNTAFWNTNTKPQKVFVIWDDNEVVKDVKINKTTLTISFTATGNKGNALIGVYDKWADSKDDDVLWSWHIWCTDPPQHLKQYDLEDAEYILLDRNIGATSADPADGSATWGYYYQFGRKDPLRAYAGMARDLKTAPQELEEVVNHPTYFYNLNTKTCEWFNNSTSSLATVTADLWGNPFMAFCSTENIHPSPALRGELKKTIYDPCPPGYMVPPENTWKGVDAEEIQVLEEGVLIPTASGDSFYPFAGFISALNSTENATYLGWYAYQGFNYSHTHSESLAATVWTSCTGPYSRWLSPEQFTQYVYYGCYYMTAWFGQGAPLTKEELNFDATQYHIRQMGRPVRCVKLFED